MKKSIYLIIIMTVIFLSGCGTKDTMVDFIPSPIPTEVGSDGSDQDAEATKAPLPSQKAEYLGDTVTKYANGDNINVRPAPSTEGDPVGTLSFADKVEVISVENGWASIIYNGSICYIKAAFLVDNKPEPSNAPTKVPTKVPTKKPTPTPKEELNTPDNSNTPTPTQKPDSEGPEI